MQLMQQIKITNISNNPLPEYQTKYSAGMDLRAALQSNNSCENENADNTITLAANGGTALVPTGLAIALPEGYEAQVRPRSGLAAKYGVTVLNSPGTIDADYRGEIKVILINHGKDPFVINHGDRVAQMIIARYEQVEWQQVDVLDETERGTGGFGHTGK